MRTRHRSSSAHDRGQAYTLEGFIGAALILIAVLLASQSSGLGGAIDGSDERDRQNQLQQEAQDALVVAATAEDRPGNLSTLVRAWDGDQFASAELENYVLGEVLNEQFGESPRNEAYRIDFNFETENGSMARETVYTSTDDGPGASAVAASYTVSIFERDETTSASERISSSGLERGSVEAVVGVEVTVW